MSISPHPEDAQSLWQGVVRAESALRDSLKTFLSATAGERVQLVRQAMRHPGSDRAVAVRVLPYLTLADRQTLFPDLVWLASWGHGLVQSARDAILTLPRPWVLARIEAVAEPLLAQSSQESQFEEYRRLLELYQQLGEPSLIRRLAQRAADHAEEDVSEAGREFLLSNR